MTNKKKLELPYVAVSSDEVIEAADLLDEIIVEESKAKKAPKNNREPDLEAIAETMKDLNKKFGKGTLRLLGKDPLPEMEFHSTNIKELDLMLGGGVPKGKMIMVAGNEGAGKSSFCMHMLKKFELALYVDAENSFTLERAQVFGGDPNKIILVRPDYGEQAIDTIFQMARNGIPLIVVDSIPSLTPKREFESETAEKQAGVAQFANVFSRKAFGLANICEKSGTSIIYINQVRDKMNAMPFGEQTTMPGGHAIKHAVWYVVKVARKETLKASGEAVGMLCSFTTGQKIRSASPFQQADVALIFDKGFVPLEVMKTEMLAARKRSLARQKIADRDSVMDSTESDIETSIE